MGHVLYEASFKIHPAFLIPLIMMIYIAFFPKILKKRSMTRYAEINDKFVKIFCIGAFVFVAIFTVVSVIFQLNMYNETVGEYKKGNYAIVEGYVENFDPMPRTGHKFESFDIDGVPFFYSDSSIQPGYNNARSRGGVITGNGQHLRIGYVYYNRSYGNIIVYIEELP